MVQITSDDRFPGEEVALHFYADKEVYDKFLGILKQAGLKFSCEDALPFTYKICRIEQDQW